MTTTWQIFDTKYQTVDGVVTKVVYGCTTQLGNEIARKVAELELIGDSSAQAFIPYSELSENVILQWVKASLGVEQVATIEEVLQQTVVDRKSAKELETVKSGLPWRQ